MSVYAVKGKTKEIFLPVTPSTALTGATFVTFTTGKLVAATAGTAAVDIVGVLKNTIASTDSDYASDRLVPVLVPVEKHVEYEITTASLVAADIGGEFDLTDAGTVNRGASSVDVVKCVKVISATKGVFLAKINGSY
jgi:hypothetical protein